MRADSHTPPPLEMHQNAPNSGAEKKVRTPSRKRAKLDAGRAAEPAATGEVEEKEGAAAVRDGDGDDGDGDGITLFSARTSSSRATKRGAETGERGRSVGDSNTRAGDILPSRVTLDEEGGGEVFGGYSLKPQALNRYPLF